MVFSHGRGNLCCLLVVSGFFFYLHAVLAKDEKYRDSANNITNAGPLGVLCIRNLLSKIAVRYGKVDLRNFYLLKMLESEPQFLIEQFLIKRMILEKLQHNWFHQRNISYEDP